MPTCGSLDDPTMQAYENHGRQAPQGLDHIAAEDPVKALLIGMAIQIAMAVGVSLAAGLILEKTLRTSDESVEIQK